MKVLSAEQIRSADQYTIEHEPISSIDLMERAAEACVDWILDNVKLEGRQVHVICGMGNNGGDGLVIARKLSEHHHVKVSIVQFSATGSNDFETNLKRMPEIEIEKLNEQDHDLRITDSELVVDAIFGSGLSRPISGWIKDVIQSVNRSNALKISIDVPSGIFVDDNSLNDLDAVVKADVTLSFQNPKLAFLSPESGAYCGEWELLDIGLDQGFIDSCQSNYSTLDAISISEILQPREKFAHKGKYGHALLVSGSHGKMGAAVLAARSSLKSGAGLLTCLVPDSGNDVMQTSVPEAMTLSAGEHELVNSPDNLEVFNVIGIGPGIGTSQSTVKALNKMLESFHSPVVLDADALNIIAENKSILKFIPPQSILTPHPGEFRRLVGDWENDTDRLRLLQTFSRDNQVVVVLKGAHTAIASPDGQVCFNTSGNPGMATAGSGDVLCGMITGLLARGYEPLDAAKIGVFVHGMAGDLAAMAEGEESMVAGDIINQIANAMNTLTE